jgi:hypothetical protein
MTEWNGNSTAASGASARARQWFEDHPVITITATVLVLAAAGFGIWHGLGLTSAPQNAADVRVYFYDLGTKQLFAAKRTEIPPIDTPSGPKMGVRARVYGWGSKPREHLFVAYLERFTDKAKESMEAQIKQGTYDPLNAPLPVGQEAMEFRAVEGNVWVPGNSAQGSDLASEPYKHCPPGENAIELDPNSP